MVFKKSKKSEKNSNDKKIDGKRFGKKAKIFVAILLLVVTLGASAYFYYLNYIKKADISNVELNAQQVKDLLVELGGKMALPEGETPTIATVTDITKLSGQDFFKNAKNGDKVVIYESTKKAILYRPSAGKIIDVSPVNLNTNSQGEIVSESSSGSKSADLLDSEKVTPSPTEVEKVKVTVLNSTKESGLARKGANLLDEEKFEIVSTSNSIGEYEGTTVSVVNKSNVKSDEASLVSKSLSKVNAKVTNLPQGEAAPAGVDIVVILGSDFSEAY